MPSVIVQKWEESERGWGTRPDGYSIHKTLDDLDGYVRDYWAHMPGRAPDEYSRPHGTPYTAQVSDEAFANLEGKLGVRYHGSNYPGSGGRDGWRKFTL